MNAIAIRAESLSKRYRLAEVERYTTLRDALAHATRSPLRFLRASPKKTFWALKDVNFEVRHGEVLGLIGRNGAGKTTLLKILSRITRPTSGWAEIYGRVGSLLEVGTGFHPELTGRENVYLSGAILGMTRKEINRKFDEIVAFSELQMFLDMAVKHYSSGMYVRLAFAVAAHLEPEILFVDEVLAVGDISFQKKCLGKMGDVARAGRTVVLVSHSMAAISALCSRCIILDHGAIEFDGSTAEATARYYAESFKITDGSELLARPRKGNGKARFTSIFVQALDYAGNRIPVAYPGCHLNLSVDIRCESDFAPANLAIIFYDSTGYRVIDTNTAQKGEFVTLRRGQTAQATFLLREVLLKPGRYLIGLWLGRDMLETIDDIEHATAIDFAQNDETNRHSIVFPGTYLCRFEQSILVREKMLVENAP